MRLRSSLVILTLLFGCSDFDCPNGEPRVDGMCPAADGSPFDPEPKTKTLSMACEDSFFPTGDATDWGWLEWELTVDPTPIRSEETFGAEFEAIARFPEFFIRQSQNVPGGASRVKALDFRATVHVRRGAVDPEPVTLALAEVDKTCEYDTNGNTVSEGDFPTCSKENDNADGSNEDCIGLGGAPSPENPCATFIDIPISTDCDPGGVCDSVVYSVAWIGRTAMELCQMNGFCVTGPVEVPLKGSHDFYTAADAGHVLFGWDDANTGAEIDQTGGPNDGGLILPGADLDLPRGPNSMHVAVGPIEVALECTMATAGWYQLAVATRDDRPVPAPDHMLISFPIQEP